MNSHDIDHLVRDATFQQAIIDPPAISCPHCGGEDFHVLQSTRGHAIFRYRFDAERFAENGDMWNGVDLRPARSAHCSDCGRRVGRFLGEVEAVPRAEFDRVFDIVTLILVRDGRLMLVRKRGQDLLILPGGKPEPDEAETATLRREITEELGCGLRRPKRLGVVLDAAGGQSGIGVRVTMYSAELVGEPRPLAEIEQIVWRDIANPGADVAPSLRNQIFPWLRLLGERR